MRRTLQVDRPYDLSGSIASLQVGRRDPSLRLRSGEALWAVRTAAGATTVHLRQHDDTVEAEAWGGGAATLLAELPERIGLADSSPELFTPQVAPLRRLALRGQGLRFPRHPSVFAALLRFVLAQKVSGLEAGQAYRRLVRTWGEPAPGPGGLWLPPTPAELRAHSWEELHPLGVEKQRADRLRHVAARMAELTTLTDLAPEEAQRRLCSVRGLGPWTAAKVIRQCLGDPDAVELGDYNTPHLVAFNLAGEPRSDDDRMLELLEPYRGWRGRVITLLERYGRHPPRRAPRAELRRLERR